MKRVMVRYQVKPEHVAANETLVRDVFVELARSAPPGIRYATFKLADGASFMHLASVETDDGSNPLTSLDAFRAFTSALRERCEVAPVTTELEEIGSYRVLGG